ncbi:MAG: peptidoglycan-associated lipoprotein Pal [Syntrophaceae bacterium]
MKRSWVPVGVVLVISLSLCIFGCAKKAVPEKTEEMQPAMEQPAPPAPEQAPPMEPPKVETAQPMPSLEDQIREFEDQDVLFDFDKYNLNPDALPILGEKSVFMKAHPEMKIRIEGNCDERGTVEYNLALGDRRAKSAKDFLVTSGVSEAQIETISYGEERPLDPGHNEEAWAKNRRDHFVITSIKK